MTFYVVGRDPMLWECAEYLMGKSCHVVEMNWICRGKELLCNGSELDKSLELITLSCRRVEYVMGTCNTCYVKKWAWRGNDLLCLWSELSCRGFLYLCRLI